MSKKFLRYEDCPCCGSPKALTVYSDGFCKCHSIGCDYIAYSRKHSKLILIKQALERLFEKSG